MLSVSSLIDFLLSLLRDEEALAEFEADPDGALARSGLDGVSADDIRDVLPLLSDCSGVTAHGRGHYDDDDPVRVIREAVRDHHAEPQVVHKTIYKEYHEHNSYFVDDRDNGVFIEDSFNQDNDGVDNKGGEIVDSTVGGNDVVGSGNDNDGVDNDGTIDGSLNEDASQNTTVEVQDSLNLDVTGRDAADDPYQTGGPDQLHAAAGGTTE